jgi:hypothetical protein
LAHLEVAARPLALVKVVLMELEETDRYLQQFHEQHPLLFLLATAGLGSILAGVMIGIANLLDWWVK